VRRLVDFIYQTPTGEFPLEKNLILSLSAPMEEFEDYRESFEKILKSMEFDVEKIPAERGVIRYSRILEESRTMEFAGHNVFKQAQLTLHQAWSAGSFLKSSHLCLTLH